MFRGSQPSSAWMQPFVKMDSSHLLFSCRETAEWPGLHPRPCPHPGSLENSNRDKILHRGLGAGAGAERQHTEPCSRGPSSGLSLWPSLITCPSTGCLLGPETHVFWGLYRANLLNTHPESTEGSEGRSCRACRILGLPGKPSPRGLGQETKH